MILVVGGGQYFFTLKYILIVVLLEYHIYIYMIFWSLLIIPFVSPSFGVCVAFHDVEPTMNSEKHNTLV